MDMTSYQASKIPQFALIEILQRDKIEKQTKMEKYDISLSPLTGLTSPSGVFSG